MIPLKRVSVTGYKSIREAELEFSDINILIGSNGAGKSNLLSLFELLQSIKALQFQNHVMEQGGANVLLYNGRKVTEAITLNVYGETLMFYARMQAKTGDHLYFAQQGLYDYKNQHNLYAADGFAELKDNGLVRKSGILDNMGVYHFHDTSVSSPMKATCNINDNLELAADGRNISAVLYRIKCTDPAAYERIQKNIQLAAPYFQDFILRENPLNPQTIRLEWKKAGCDIPFGADQLSDGTLRFICLVVLLCLPADIRKNIIFIDEPELGLHPFSMTVISELIKKYAQNGQVIAATQSAEFINEFRASDIVVAENHNGESQFHRLEEKELEEWLEDYTIGELWLKNVIGEYGVDDIMEEYLILDADIQEKRHKDETKAVLEELDRKKEELEREKERAQQKEQKEQELQELSLWLLSQERIEDVKHALTDEGFQKAMLEEFRASKK